MQLQDVWSNTCLVSENYQTALFLHTTETCTGLQVMLIDTLYSDLTMYMCKMNELLFLPVVRLHSNQFVTYQKYKSQIFFCLFEEFFSTFLLMKTHFWRGYFSLVGFTKT